VDDHRGAMHPTLTLVIIGVSGSGKSSLMRHIAARVGWPRAEGDDFHPATNVAKMASGHPLTDEDRWPWLRALAGWIGQREASGENAVLACSALKRAYRDVLREGHPSVRFVHLVVDRGVLERRLADRGGHYMPASLLRSQLDALEDLQPDEPGFAVSGELPLDRIFAIVDARFGLTSRPR
jgi:gluconokinase